MVLGPFTEVVDTPACVRACTHTRMSTSKTGRIRRWKDGIIFNIRLLEWGPLFPRTPMDDQHQTPPRPRPLPTLQDCLPPGLLLDYANSSHLLGLLNPTLYMGFY